MQTLIDEVVDGVHDDADELLNELPLAERFGVSRGVAREALRALEERRLVSVRHGRGARVLPPDGWDLLDPDILTAVAVRPDRFDLLDQVLECRRIVEGEAAALAAERATDEGLEALADALAAMKAAARASGPARRAGERLLEAETVFHRRLVALAQNRPLAQMLEPVHIALATARQELVDGRVPALVRQHERLAAAVRARDPAAARTALHEQVDQLRRWLPGESGRHPRARRASPA